MIFGIFMPKNPELFDGHKEISYLIHDEYSKENRMDVLKSVDDFFDDLFEIPIEKLETSNSIDIEETLADAKKVENPKIDIEIEKG